MKQVRAPATSSLNLAGKSGRFRDNFVHEIRSYRYRLILQSFNREMLSV